MDDIDHLIPFIDLIYLYTDYTSLLLLKHIDTYHTSRKSLLIENEAGKFRPILNDIFSFVSFT